MDATQKIRCPKCGVESGAMAQLCYSCGADLRTGEIPGPTAEPEASVVHRYRNAYHHARAICTMGSLVKGAALALAGLFAFAGLVMSQQSHQGSMYVAAGIAAAIAVGVPVYILGILVSAQGEILKATLDTAVQSSPFMSEGQMREAMGLS